MYNTKIYVKSVNAYQPELTIVNNNILPKIRKEFRY